MYDFTKEYHYQHPSQNKNKNKNKNMNMNINKNKSKNKNKNMNKEFILHQFKITNNIRGLSENITGEWRLLRKGGNQILTFVAEGTQILPNTNYQKLKWLK